MPDLRRRDHGAPRLLQRRQSIRRSSWSCSRSAGAWTECDRRAQQDPSAEISGPTRLNLYSNAVVTCRGRSESARNRPPAWPRARLAFSMSVRCARVASAPDQRVNVRLAAGSLEQFVEILRQAGEALLVVRLAAEARDRDVIRSPRAREARRTAANEQRPEPSSSHDPPLAPQQPFGAAQEQNQQEDRSACSRVPWSLEL